MLFRQSEYARAAAEYARAAATCPMEYTEVHTALHINAAAALMKQNIFDKAIDECTQAIDLDHMNIKVSIKNTGMPVIQ